jgi:hypothetical protein
MYIFANTLYTSYNTNVKYFARRSQPMTSGNGKHRPDTDDAWRDTDDGCEYEFADNREVEVFSDGMMGEQNSCCSI